MHGRLKQEDLEFKARLGYTSKPSKEEGMGREKAGGGKKNKMDKHIRTPDWEHFQPIAIALSSTSWQKELSKPLSLLSYLSIPPPLKSTRLKKIKITEHLLCVRYPGCFYVVRELS